MESHEVAELFDQAVERLRLVIGSVGTDDGSDLLGHAASSGEVAVELAVGKLADPDPVVRAAACDLLGVASSQHMDVREVVATALIVLAANEPDPEVHWSIARALGDTFDARALPTLVTLAGSPDADVRFHVAVAVPAVLDDPPVEVGVAALTTLCTDSDPDVREWATFGLGWSTTADGDDVRRALWDRTRDVEPGVREEGARGLARRRDARALPLVRELLAQDAVHRHTFQAAAYLADPSLLPLLDGFDPTAEGVAEALLECDPLRRAQRDEAAWQVMTTLHLLRPDLRVALLGERCDLGLFLDIGDGSGRCFVDALLNRAGYDPARAVKLVIAGVTR
ncbi:MULTISPECIES: HEAT repeat domain-containing protein [unclassified Micromonospora]|uniref:HEAT repeat domain-containing protein n=1 Tax=unclassified Micromonospora TaxID=2617518 RepID=UPI001B3712F1|nr:MULTISPECIES: HEAT repeat domain-containing protein [unclassified Micromonospora]MBQ0980198.1 HEAT repeat domain-containing protein [Micromonospora sp. M61]MBQ1039477.1 HEAT repeat domain-containing protein [Micromonospora sp. C81]